MARELTEQGFAEVAKRFKVLSDPVRLKILYELRQQGELTVGAVAEQLGCSQPNASRQLARLLQGGMVARRHEGTQVIYFIEDPGIFELCENVCGRIEAEQQDNAYFEASTEP